jgi:ABC-type transport system involved in cytochrome c biogenesis permease subunit
MYWSIVITSAALGLAAVAALLWLGWWRFPKRQVDRLRLSVRDPKARADIEDNLRKTIGQLIAGFAVLIGAGFAYLQFTQQQQASHQQFLQQQQASRDLLISNQVAKGFEQLGSD